MEASARTQSGLSQTQGGPYQSQVGQASQYSHAASPHSDGNGNQVTQRPSSPSLLYDLLTANITKPESGNFIPQNGAHWSGQTPNWQTARAPQQTVSSLQVPAGGRSNNYHQGTFTQDNAAMQASCVKVQSGNNEPQQALHQNSLNRPDPSPPNGIQHNPLYLLQGVVSKALIQQWHMLRLDLMDQEEEGVVSNSNQQVPIQGKQPVVAQDVSVNCVPPNRLQCGDAENASYQNVNRIPVNTLPAPATSVQHRHMSPARTSMSTTTYSQQMTHNNSNGYGIDGFQRGVLPHTTAPSQSQSLQSISHVMTSDSSSGQSLTQITEMATSSSHSATHPSGSQYSDGRNFPKINGPHTGTLPNSQMIPGDANNVNLRQAAGSTRFLTVVNNAVNSGTRLATSPNASPPYFPVQKDISSNQHSSGAPPEGRPVQKGYYVIVSEDESVKGFKVDDIVFHEHKADTNGISKGLQRCSLNEVLQQEQCHLSSGKTSLQRHGQQSLPQTPASSSKVKDSNHIYPGHAGQKAIAIVKPLSQTNNKDVYSDMCSGQCKQTTTTDESGRVCEETSIVKPFVDHIAESTSLTQRHKYVNGNVSLEMSTEEGADAMTNHDTGQSETLPNYLHAEDVESQPSGRMQATPTSHQPVTTEVPSSRSEAMGETKRRDEPIVEFDLSSVPLIQWKYDNLTKLIEILDKRINSKILSFLSQNEITIPGVASTILSMFWEATYENVWMEVDSHTSLINEIEEFCSKHVASDSVILSYSQELIKNCYILTHDAVHCENTYKSSWLNTNEQLDGIHKEFDFPWSLKYGLTSLERDEQPTLIETENGFPENAASEVQNEGVSPIEITTLCDDDYVEKQASSARDGLNQTPVPLENATADSIDSSYSFKIDVLPPEEARTLFEKLDSEQVNTENTEDHSEMIMNVEDDLPEMATVRLGEVKLKNKVQAPIQEFCCTMRLMEVMGGSNTPSLCNCQPRREQSADGVTVKRCEEERDVQTENVMNLDPSMESKNKVDIGNAMDNQTLTPTWMTECENLLDITEEDEILHSQTNMEPKRILPSRTPSVDSNIIVQEIDDFFSCNETELSILNSELEMCYGQSEQKRPESTETQFNTEQQTLTFQNDVSLDSQLTSTEKRNQVTFLSSLSLAQNNFCIPHPKNYLSLKAETPDLLPFLKKIKVSLDPNSLPAPEDNLTPVDQPLNGNGNIDDLEPVHSKAVTVKLALFGSSPQKEHGTVINSQRSSNRHSMSCRNNFYLIGTPQPPTTVSVTVGYKQKEPTELTPIGGSRVMKSPDKQGISEEPSETGPKSDSPVEQPMLEGPSETGPVFHSTIKQRIYEEWRNCFVPTKRKSRGRVKSLKHFIQTKRKSRGRVMRLKKGSFASSRRVRPETTKARPPTVTEELPVASEGKSPPGTDETKHAWSAQRESFLKSLRQRVEKSKTFPKTFNFNHGPGDPEESTDPQLDIPDPDKEHGQDSERPAKRLKGVWAPDPPKKYTPLPSRDSQVPKTSTIFQQFQKKYKKKKKKK